MNISFGGQSGKWTGEILGSGRPVRGYQKESSLIPTEAWPESAAGGKEEKDMNVRNSGTGIDMGIRVMGSIGKRRTQMSQGLG